MRERNRRASRALVGALLAGVPWLLAAGALPAAAAPRPGTVKERMTNKVAMVERYTTLTLAPIALATKSQQSMNRGGLINLTGDPVVALPPSSNLFVGYLHDTNGHDEQGTGYESRNEYYRAALRFDLSALAGHSLHQALLRLRVFRTHHRGVHSNPDNWDSSSSCAVAVAAGKSYWWQHIVDVPDAIEIADPTLAIAPNATADLQIDVTAIAAGWLKGPNANYGLVLKGDNEDLGAYTETICQTQYVHAGDGAPTLVVEYQ